MALAEEAKKLSRQLEEGLNELAREQQLLTALVQENKAVLEVIRPKSFFCISSLVFFGRNSLFLGLLKLLKRTLHPLIQSVMIFFSTLSMVRILMPTSFSRSILV